MATPSSTFLLPTLLADPLQRRRSHSFASSAPHEPHHPHHAPPAPYMMQQHHHQTPQEHHTAAAMPSSKLPSLEAILKNILTDPRHAHPTESQARPHLQLPPVSLARTASGALPSLMLHHQRSAPGSVSSASSSTASPPYSPQSFEMTALPTPPRKRTWPNSEEHYMAHKTVDMHGTGSHSSHSHSHGAAVHRTRASKFCKVEGCERVSQRNNLCHSHGGKRLCKESGCSSKDRGNGFCIKHGGGKICAVDGCEKKARRKGMCTQHFRVCDGV